MRLLHLGHHDQRGSPAGPRTSEPSETAIREALDRNLCRCGAHNRIVRAVQRAAAEMRAGAA